MSKQTTDQNNSVEPDVPSEDVTLQLQQQIADLTDALQRERADVSNVRRRHEEQISSLKTMIKADVVRDLLPVIDNFERALRVVPVWDNGEQSTSSTTKESATAWSKWAEGVQGVVKQFDKTLTDIGVERIGIVDEPFDPAYHEAVSMEEGEGTEEVISEVLQSGYKIGEEVIRHATVRVATR